MNVISPSKKLIFTNFIFTVNGNGELFTCDELTNSKLVTCDTSDEFTGSQFLHTTFYL